MRRILDPCLPHRTCCSVGLTWICWTRIPGEHNHPTARRRTCVDMRFVGSRMRDISLRTLGHFTLVRLRSNFLHGRRRFLGVRRPVCAPERSRSCLCVGVGVVGRPLRKTSRCVGPSLSQCPSVLSPFAFGQLTPFSLAQQKAEALERRTMLSGKRSAQLRVVSAPPGSCSGGSILARCYARAFAEVPAGATRWKEREPTSSTEVLTDRLYV